MPLTQTNDPGKFALPELGVIIQISEWEEKDVYDTLAIDGGTQLAGETFPFFTDVEQKQRCDTNLKKGASMPSRTNLIVLKPSLRVKPLWGQAIATLEDQIAIYEEGIYYLNKNDKPQVTFTHLMRLQSGYGVVAYGLSTGAATAPTSLGVASPAAIPPLLIPFELQPDDDFDGHLDFVASRAGAQNQAGTTPVFASHVLGVDVAVVNYLHGFVKAPGTR